MQNITKDPMFRFLALLSIAATVGLQTWQTLFNNFAVEIVHLEGNHIGIIQSLREIPGFLALLVIYIILILKEHRLSALSIAILGLGIGITGIFPSYTGLIATTMIMSFGFHYFETTNNSLTLQYFEQDKSPLVIGKLRSYGAAANIAVGIFIYIISYFLSYKTTFGLIGFVIVIVGFWGILQNPTRKGLPVQQKKMIFKKKYWLYYFLTFMAGARRQIFVAFAVFLLVKIFEFSIQEITILFVLNNSINYFLNPLIGKAIIRFGERKVLSLEYFSLIIVFVGYAFVESKIIIAVLYVLDHIFFNFSMGIRTYFQKIGDPKDITPSMAVGFTINHIAAVIIPALGGLMWILDYRIPFIAGAIMSAISLLFVQFIKCNKP
ncbi:MAG: MFS transporter [Candidatus Marinimicrobia bacterium]|nr:MFS transporter [Candidatus Neomarinimicrobiota bacterium]